jgi:hypothetical protein
MNGRERQLLGVLVLVVLAGVLVGSELCQATMIDLTTAGASGTVNGAIFRQINPDTAAGSGVFDSFVRIQNKGIEHGYNTDGIVEYDTKVGSWTRSLLLSSVPIVIIDSISYREFCLDINQNGNVLLSLDELKIHLAGACNLTGYPTGFGPVVYDLDGGEDSWVKMDYTLNAGSGKGDIVVLVPTSVFSGSGQYVYLYSKLGVNLIADDGFEEWGVGNTGPITPEPSTIALLGIGALVLLRKRKIHHNLSR